MELRQALITQSPSLSLQHEKNGIDPSEHVKAAQVVAELWRSQHEQKVQALIDAAQAMVDAWDSAPGLETYRYGPLMDWLTKTMLPAISKLRESMQ